VIDDLDFIDDLDDMQVAGLCPFDEGESNSPRYVHCCDSHGNPAPDWPNGGRCGAHWGSPGTFAHCARCHLTFCNDHSWDKHNGYRKSPCMTVAELTEAGWECTPGEIAEGHRLADAWRKPKPDNNALEDE